MRARAGDDADSDGRDRGPIPADRRTEERTAVGRRTTTRFCDIAAALLARTAAQAARTILGDPASADARREQTTEDAWPQAFPGSAGARGEAPAALACTQCGYEKRLTARYCGSCGEAFGLEGAGPAPTAVSTEQDPRPSSSPRRLRRRRWLRPALTTLPPTRRPFSMTRRRPQKLEAPESASVAAPEMRLRRGSTGRPERLSMRRPSSRSCDGSTVNAAEFPDPPLYARDRLRRRGERASLAPGLVALVESLAV